MGIEARALVLALLLSLALMGLALYVVRVGHTGPEETLKVGKILFPLSAVLSAFAASLVTLALCRRYSIGRDLLPYLMKSDELKIVELLIEHGGEMKQAELVVLSGLHKVRVHRALRSMEERGLVEVVRAGRQNIVKLSAPVWGKLRWLQ